MKKIALTLMSVFLFSHVSKAQKFDNYSNLWKEVQQNEVKNLPKSALKVVETIYKKAEKQKNSPQLVKALLYKSKFALTLEEDAKLSVISNLKTEIEKAETPTKNVLESVLANLYWQYFQQNRWKFYNRTKTSEKIDTVDFRTWDLNTLFTEIHTHFQNSLQNGIILQQTKLEQFNDILHLQKDSKLYRPTLYDFIAHNALDFYKTSENSITKPADKFVISAKDFEQFYKINTSYLNEKDKQSLQLNALNIYQSLIAFHNKNNNKNAFVSVELERLKFLNQHSNFEGENELFFNKLIELKEDFKSHEASTLIDFEIASVHNEKGNEYNSENTKHQFEKAKAVEICDLAIEKFPESLGTKQCKNLKESILQQEISIITEKHIPTNLHSKISVFFKNFNKLNTTIYKVSEKEIRTFNKIYNDSTKIAYINKLKKVEALKNTLKNEKDYQQHITEIVLPPLKNGNYLLVASPQEVLNKNSTFATTTIQSTNISVVQKSTNEQHIYQVIDRNTGEPFTDAKVSVKNYDISRYNKSISKNLVTNEFGEFNFKTRNYHRNVAITVETKNEKAAFEDYYLNENRKPRIEKNNDDEITIKPFIFTDRSIYRPGQTVHFKAIFLKKQGDKSEVFTNEYVSFILENPNGEEIKEIELKLNEFGSVSESFILPNNGLNGEYTIYVDESYEHDNTNFYNNADYDFDYLEHTISVEEYKRPKFEAEFKPVTETFKLNDSVTVKGNATAFAGSSISDAKVTYRVHRKVIYPRWFYWYRPSYNTSGAMEITHGETKTDNEGNFEITFKSIPDKSADKENKPVFTYEIEADITDINGETRSATTLVKVGYHTLDISASISDKIDLNEKTHKITLTTNNLNGEFVPTKGALKIYKLLAPVNVLRERPWSVPDYQVLSKNEYQNLFPHEPYTNDENKVNNWKKGALVYETEFNTEESKEIQLKKIKNWNIGKYLIEVEANDKFNQKVEDKTRFSVFNSKKPAVADNQLFEISTDKNLYKTNENVQLKIGSASNEVFVTIAIEKNHKIVSQQIVKLNNEVKFIKIPVEQEDLGGFAIKYSFSAYNSFKSGVLNIAVPKQLNDISIETQTFRNKLQPGQEETWSFKIKGANKDKITAEVLASMYDASLDQFKSHSWSFNPIQHSSYYSYNNWNTQNSYGNTSFRVYNLSRHYYNNQTQNFDKLNWFGFSLNNNRYLQRTYMAKAKASVERKESQRSSYDKIVSGVVTDNDGQPLPGVSVIISGTTFGTQTDFDGAYSIKVKKGDELQYSYIGFSTTGKTIGTSSTMDISLEASNEALEEVVVVGYGTQRKASLTGSISTVKSEVSEDVSMILEGKVAGVNISGTSGANKKVMIRGTNSTNTKNALYIVDGVPVNKFEIGNAEILSINVLKDAAATSIYGSRGANGVIIISTKSGQKKLEKDLANVKARKNFKETAFFFPHLKTDKDGCVSFNFTMPEALTRWKLQLLAHTPQLETATKTLTTVTQKDLMVLPNPPRFLREGDVLQFSSKISNLSDKALNGVAQLVLTDAITGQDVTKQLLKASLPSGEMSKGQRGLQNFMVDAKGNTNVMWTLTIPDNVQAVQYKIVAKAGEFSDGEQNVLPVLSNRMLVTETLPMWVRSKQTKTFKLDKLINSASTPLSDRTLKNHKLTLEITSNPAWYAVQSLPYLMEYPYECAEQTFSRYYANTLASHIANSNPRIQEVFNLWKTSDALVSNLEKNEELKSIIIQETPWLRDAQNETEQKKRIGLLFDLNKMKNEQEIALNKLKELQFSNGGFPWFKGSKYPNRYITQHIASSYGHLKQLRSLSGVEMTDGEASKMITKAVQFLDDEILDDYNKLLERAKKTREKAKTKSKGIKAEKEFLEKNNLGHTQLHYLYMRSFYKNVEVPSKVQKAVDYYTKQSATYWTDFNLYSKGMIALIQHRNENKTITSDILKSLKENSITSEELGMYWKANTPSWFWYQSPIETQALMIEVFAEAGNVILSETKNLETIDNLKIWLLKNKQTNQWKTTKATTEAVYALLLQGSDWLSVNESVDVTIGTQKIEPSKLENVKVEAGTGYFKTSWNGNEITSEMGEVTLSKKDEGIAWGGLYWQYFEDLDKITSAETPLKLSKKLFLKQNTNTGKELTEITENTNLKVGDLITVRVELRADRPMEFVHMKDMRASGLEPINVLSSYKWQDGLGYYESTKDASTNFFMERLPKGVYVFEYDLRVNNAGNFSNGITTIQSMYAPEFSSHSEGVRVRIED
ncbi:TonB-dependent outer membrane receptor, SusC/RagA subfamily, signature region [Lutibacter oricola]|uniref:TonB-dependent outer membrane receptor, SusC/RagA subfamily, signature region n=1 Tax=Lutibacter oricola TaxID=762486 RepID=A0A1H2YX79_9FLAO|nr:MG2 domain-containing protein [Lutibacter oricola]SDX09802.1 TonB-dependent outer membrane receptor, SusC/RagA subfamily, signature region [Lutibacter oricola]